MSNLKLTFVVAADRPVRISKSGKTIYGRFDLRYKITTEDVVCLILNDGSTVWVGKLEALGEPNTKFRRSMLFNAIKLEVYTTGQ